MDSMLVHLRLSRRMFAVTGGNRRCETICAVMRNVVAITATPEPGSSGFAEVYERTVTDVYSYLASRSGDRHTAEELTQEVFVAGARRVAAGEVVDLAWLKAVARHKLVDHWRARAREDRTLALVEASEWARPVEEPLEIDPGVAAAVLASLNPTYRAALILRHVDGLSVSAVAAHLERTVEATEQVLSRARTAFRVKYRGATHE
jgi:RNA polymerase sigma-70 factor (ECF subfamily)